MNIMTQSFEEFSSSLKPTDLALYAGAALVLWVLFKDKLSPVQKLLMGLVEKGKTLLSNKNKAVVATDNGDLFFKLVTSWKQTRDLAVQGGCEEAVRVADQMFPLLSPTACEKVAK